MNKTHSAKTKSFSVTSLAKAKKIKRERRKIQAWRLVIQLLWISSFVCSAVGVVFILQYWLGFTSTLTRWAVPAVLSPLLLSPYFAVLTAHTGMVVTNYESQLNLSDVGLIVDGLPVSDTQYLEQKTLIELLPRLQASDTHLLNARHHRILNRALNGHGLKSLPSQTAFLTSILKAYEQVGSSKDLLIVERLARGEGHSKQDARVYAAAQECLPYLQARSEGQELRQTLLRASSGGADNTSTLLRPAHGANGTGPAQLLRSSEASGEDLS